MGILDTGIDSPNLGKLTLIMQEYTLCTSQHALIDDAVSRKQKTITRQLGQGRVGHFIHIARYEIARYGSTP